MAGDSLPRVTEFAYVLFGDVIDSRVSGPQAARWLRALARELDERYGTQRCAPFGFTQGDEIQGVLRLEADPFAAVLATSLRDDSDPLPRVRWAIAAGAVDAGEGPATQWTGPAFLAARELIDVARRRRDRLVVRSGDPDADALLDDVAPVLGLLLAELTESQRRVARLLILDGLRQAEAADRLEIARPTVSVAAERAHVRDIERLHRATLRILQEGAARASAAR